MSQYSLVSIILLTFASAKMKADPRPQGADIQSQSALRHGDEHPAWLGCIRGVL